MICIKWLHSYVRVYRLFNQSNCSRCWRDFALFCHFRFRYKCSHLVNVKSLICLHKDLALTFPPCRPPARLTGIYCWYTSKFQDHFPTKHPLSQNRVHFWSLLEPSKLQCPQMSSWCSSRWIPYTSQSPRFLTRHLLKPKYWSKKWKKWKKWKGKYYQEQSTW